MCAVLQVNNLTYAYDQEVKFDFPDISIARGQQLAVLGPSGCGKSTLLSLVSGLLSSQSGNISVVGENITEMNRSSLDRLRSREIGFVFQSPVFIDSLTVRENLDLSASYAQREPLDLDNLLEEMDLSHRKNAYPRQLSQGERQRLAIIRAVAHHPSLLLADEPTSALDDARAHQVIEMFKQLSEKQGMAIMLVTHDNRIQDGVLDIIQL